MGQAGKETAGRGPKVTSDRKNVSKENLFLPMWEQGRYNLQVGGSRDGKGEGSAYSVRINCDTPSGVRSFRAFKRVDSGQGCVWRAQSSCRHLLAPLEMLKGAHDISAGLMWDLRWSRAYLGRELEAWWGVTGHPASGARGARTPPGEVSRVPGFGWLWWDVTGQLSWRLAHWKGETRIALEHR